MTTERDKRILQAIDDYNRLMIHVNGKYTHRLWTLNKDATVSVDARLLRKFILAMKDATQLLEEIESECR